MKLVTGGAGFIGSHLVDALAAGGEEVVVLDNFSTGRRAFLEGSGKRRGVRILDGDCMKPADMRRALRGVDEVYHMAADPDVRAGIKKPWSNFRDGAVLTFKVLDEMRKADVSKFVFASSSTVYGEAGLRPTPEDFGPLLPISPYGASKLAGEAAVSAFVGTFGFQAWVFRFGNVVGPRLTHGVIYDFHQRLLKDPKRLVILGDGRQTKSYLSARDCVSGMLRGRRKGGKPMNVFNLASGATTNVVRIAEIVVQSMGLKGVSFEFTGGARGWAGDVSLMDLAIERMRALGWRPQDSSEDAVRLAAESLVASQPRRRLQ